ncbi:lysophospholipase [Dactylonectria estremocensis]|uniref:Lysophospholipase n=1 Tax=Dactylonectria estremocensis TaxID=1079267 RepID=A0A9P9EGS7_9HYPO|nr:lysophospholipase [Dactylonectria estremocensis]
MMFAGRFFFILVTISILHVLADELNPPFLENRGAPNAPDGYAPASVSCPATRPAVRNATGLSPQEIKWLPVRGNNTISALKTVLGRAGITGLDTDAYIDGIVSNGSQVPRVGIAISGGGYRALMNGAGALAAFDNRSANSVSDGQLGGLLQATTYLSGLSGGSWLVGSLFVQNFTSVESIIFSSKGFLSELWQFQNSILKGPEGLSGREYYRQLHDDVNNRSDAGYNTTITDYWGRALSYQLVNASDGGPSYTFSSIADDSDFANANTPLPLIVALERPGGQLLIPSNSTVFEFNPWEMGSYDTRAAAFAPLKYIGSNFTNGTLPRGGHCIAGFDNAGFVMGTSSSLFNQAFLQISHLSGVPDFLVKALNETLEQLGEENRDIASWPNPFYKYNPSDNMNANNSILTLVDGGEDLQNIPLHPLILPKRQVDVVFAIDGSADTTTYWPNGTALVATYSRSKSRASTESSDFPTIPDQNTFINLGLNMRPTFFGCNDSAASGPLIVYLPNTPYSYHSNVSTFDLEYSIDERNQIIENGYNVATMGNGTVDSNWPTCVSCAILARSLARTKTDVPGECSDCFSRYCWNGTTNSTTPATYQPEQIIESGAQRSAAWMSSIGGFVFVVCVMAFLAI